MVWRSCIDPSLEYGICFERINYYIFSKPDNLKDIIDFYRKGDDFKHINLYFIFERMITNFDLNNSNILTKYHDAMK